MYKLAISLCFSLVTFFVDAQTKNILVYASKNDYLMPLIEGKLLSLSNSNNKNLLFKGVINLNRVTSTVASEKLLRETIDYYSNTNFILNDSIRNFQKIISKYLLGSSLFLQININTLNSLIEYQLFLYNINTSGTFPKIDTSFPIRTSNVFINVMNNNYEKILEDAIKNLFPETNRAPISIIEVEKYNLYDEYLNEEKMLLFDIEQGSNTKDTIYTKQNAIVSKSLFGVKNLLNNTPKDSIKYSDRYYAKYMLNYIYSMRKTSSNIRKIRSEIDSLDAIIESLEKNSTIVKSNLNSSIPSQGQHFYVPVGEEIILNPSKSYDLESPKEHLVFTWKPKYAEGITLEPDFAYQVKENKCKIIFSNENISTWELTVNDGLLESKSQITIHPLRKKILYVNKKDRRLLNYTQLSLLNHKIASDFDELYYDINIYTDPIQKFKDQNFKIFFKGISFDTLNYIKLINKKLNTPERASKYYSSVSKDKYGYNLYLSIFPSSVGTYRVVYFENGIKSESPTIFMNNTTIGVFSIEYFMNRVNFYEKRFFESQIKISSKVLNRLEVYYSYSIPSKANESDTLSYEKSHMFGFYHTDIFSNLISKNSYSSISYGLYYRSLIGIQDNAKYPDWMPGISVSYKLGCQLYNKLTGHFSLGMRIGLTSFKKNNGETALFFGFGINL